VLIAPNQLLCYHGSAAHQADTVLQRRRGLPSMAGRTTWSRFISSYVLFSLTGRKNLLWKTVSYIRYFEVDFFKKEKCYLTAKLF